MANQVTRWEASDGTLHETEEAANQHDAREAASDNLLAWCESRCCGSYGIKSRELYSEMCKCAVYLEDLLHVIRG